MYKNRHFNEERRWRLFYDRPYVWGRWPKIVLAFASSMMFWAAYYTYMRQSW